MLACDVVYSSIGRRRHTNKRLKIKTLSPCLSSCSILKSVCMHGLRKASRGNRQSDRDALYKRRQKLPRKSHVMNKKLTLSHSSPIWQMILSWYRLYIVSPSFYTLQHTLLLCLFLVSTTIFPISVFSVFFAHSLPLSWLYIFFVFLF